MRLGLCSLAVAFVALTAGPAVGFNGALTPFGSAVARGRSSKSRFAPPPDAVFSRQECKQLLSKPPQSARRPTTYRAAQSLHAVPCPQDEGVALVVFHGFGDLRLHDHGGLAAAASTQELHCVALLDPALLSNMPDRKIRLLWTAIRDVGISLKAHGISLQVRVGDSRKEAAAAIETVQATDVYVHSDPEAAAQLAMQGIAAGVQASQGDNVRLHEWSAAVRSGEFDHVDDFISYRNLCERGFLSTNSEFKSRELLSARTTSASASFEMPSMEEVMAQVAGGRGDSQVAAFAARARSGNVGDREEMSETVALQLWEKYALLGEREFARREIATLATGEGSLEHVAARVYGVQGFALGEPFLRAFSEALALGCLSTRSILHDSNGRLMTPVWSQSPIPFALTGEPERSVHMAREALEAREWHRILASRDNRLDALRDDVEEFQFRYWRWKGFLVRYALNAGARSAADTPRPVEQRPALVLVHGFGASADQWNHLIGRLPHYDVWAIDLLGFGHSEKPTLSYTQFLWEDVVRDFVLECVGRPAVLAGNSIGGYTALCAATSLKQWCPGLILCNSAGRMLSKSDWEIENQECYGGSGLGATMLERGLPAKQAPPNWALDLFGRVLIAALRPNVAQACKFVYPNRPEAADARLVSNIVRDSKDPGGYAVIAAGAKLPKPITKNELLHEFGKPLLVAQGLNDPLGGGIAKTRFSLYKDAHPEPALVRLVGLEAGHCPHHEAADLVAAEVDKFLSSLPATSSSSPEAGGKEEQASSTAS